MWKNALKIRLKESLGIKAEHIARIRFS
jgi:hypothetical protein